MSQLSVNSKQRGNKNEKREKRPPRSFVGRRLKGISFTASNFTLHFDGHVGIVVRCEYSLQTNPGSELEKIEVPEFHRELTKLLDQTVESESLSEDGALAVEFSRGAVLTCYRVTAADKSYGIYIV